MTSWTLKTRYQRLLVLTMTKCQAKIEVLSKKRWNNLKFQLLEASLKHTGQSNDLKWNFHFKATQILQTLQLKDKLRAILSIYTAQDIIRDLLRQQFGRCQLMGVFMEYQTKIVQLCGQWSKRMSNFLWTYKRWSQHQRILCQNLKLSHQNRSHLA